MSILGGIVAGIVFLTFMYGLRVMQDKAIREQNKTTTTTEVRGN